MKKSKKGPLLVLPTIGVASIALASATFFNQGKNNDLEKVNAALAKISVGDSTKLSIIEDKDELPDHTDTLRNGVLSFIVPESNEENGNYLDGVDLKYRHGEIKHDGEVEVIVTAQKGEEIASSTFKINVVELDRSIVDLLSNSFKDSTFSTTDTIINAADKVEAVNGEYLGIKLPDELYEANVTFSHPDITSDGPHDITINITSGSISSSTTVKVDVTGIDNAKVDGVIKAIAASGPVNYTVSRGESIIPKVPGGTDFDITKPYLNIDLTKIDTYGTKITYENVEKFSDGTLIVTFTVSSGSVSKTQTVTVNVSGLTNENDLKIVNDIAKELENKTFKHHTTLIRIDSIESEEKEAPYLDIDLSTLKSTQDGVTYNYSHAVLNDDATLDVTLEIMKGSQSTTQVVKVEVTGIDEARVKAVKEAIANLGTTKNFISSVSTINPVDGGTTFDTSSQYLGINLSTIDLLGTTITYGHQGLEGDGSIDVNFSITKGSANDTQVVKVNVTGANDTIDKEKVNEIVAELKTKTFDHTTNLITIDAVDNAIKSEEYLSIKLSELTADISGATFEYTNKELTADGQLEVTIKVTRGSQFDFAKVIVNVKGIDAARVAAVKAVIAKEPTVGYISSSAKIDQVIDGTTFNNLVPHLGIDLTSLDLLGTTITYGHQGLVGDGSIDVNFTITKGSANDTQVVKVNVTGADDTIDKEKVNEIVAELKNRTFDHTTNLITIDAVDNAIKSEEYLSIKLSELVADTSGVTFAYTNKELTADGQLEVTIKVARGSQSDTVKVMVNVKGIDAARVAAVKAEIEKIGTRTFASTVSKIEKVTSGTEFNTLLPHLGINLSSLDTLGTKITYGHEELVGDGLIDVNFTITKGTASDSQVVRVNITGANDTIDKEIVTQISTQLSNQRFTHQTDLFTIDAAGNKVVNGEYLSIDLEKVVTTNKDGVIFEYTNSELNFDGELEVTINIKRGNQNATAKVIVDVKGMNAARVAAVKKAIADLGPSTLTIPHTATSGTINKVDAGTKLFDTSSPYLGIDLSSIDMLGTTITYGHQELVGDGKLDVNFVISRSSARDTQVVPVNVTGATYVINKEIVNKIVEELKSKTFNHMTNELVIDAASREEKEVDYLSIKLSELVADTSGVTFDYSHGQITGDGKVEVSLHISRGNGSNVFSGRLPIFVNVTGIDAARVAAVKAQIASIGSRTYESTQTTIEKAEPGSQFTAFTPYLGIDLSNITTYGTSLTVEHDKLVGDGSLDVKFTITKGSASDSQVVTVNVTGANDTIDKEKVNNIVNELRTKSFTHITDLITIAAASEEAKTAPYLSIKLSELVADTSGVTFAYTNKELTADGQLEVTIKVTKGSQSDTVKVMVNVKGIDAARVAAVKAIIGQKPSVNYTSSSAKIDSVNAGTPLFNTSTNYYGIDLSSLTDTLGTTITYGHNELVGDGNLNVNFTITKGSASDSQVVTVNVTGANDTIDKEKVNNIVNELRTKSFTHITDLITIDAVDNAIKSEEYLSIKLSELVADTSGVTFAYTNKELTADGQLEVTIKVTRGSQSDTVKVMVNVKGIDAARVAAVKAAIAQKPIFNYTSNQVAIPVVNAGTSFDISKEYLGINLSDINTLGTEITYEHGLLIGDGQLEVTFTIAKGTQIDTQVVKVNVTGADDTIDKEKVNNIVNELRTKSFTHTTDLITIAAASEEAKTAPYLSIKLSELTSDTSGVTFAYTNKELTADGQLEVTIKVTKGSQSDTVKVMVNVKGIDAARVAAVKAIIGQKPSVNYTSSSAKIDSVNAGTPLFNTSTNYYGIDLSSLTDTLGTTITYGHNELVGDGNLNVNFTITKGSASDSQLVKVNVTGADDTIDKEKVNNIVNELRTKSFTHITDLITIAAASEEVKAAPYLSIKLSELTSDTSGVNFEYTNKELTADGQLEVTIKVTRGSQSDTVKVMVNVIGIDAARVAAVKAEIAKVSTANYPSTTASIPKAENLPLFNTSQEYLGINLSGLDTLGTTITYSHSALTGDGSLPVTFDISKGNAKDYEVVNVTVSGADSIIDKQTVDSILSELSKLEFNHATLLTTIKASNEEAQSSNYLSINLASLKTDTSGVSFRYSHIALEQDNTLSVTIKASKGGYTQSVTVTVNVTGIDAARVEAVRQYIENQNPSTFTTDKPSIQSASAGTPWTTNPHLGINLASVPSLGTTITFEHDAIDSDGSHKVMFSITRNSASTTQEVTVNVSGVRESIDKEIVQKIVDSLNNKTFNHHTNLIKIDSSIDKSQPNNYLSIDLSQLPVSSTGVSFTYDHEDLEEDDILTVTINVSKGSAHQKVVVKVNVTGIDAARVAAVKAIIANVGTTNFTSKTNEKIDSITDSNDLVALNNTLGINLTEIDKLGTVIKYSHDGLEENGPLNVTFTIDKGSANDTQVLTVNVDAIEKTVVDQIVQEFQQVLEFTHFTNEATIPARTDYEYTGSGDYLSIDLSKIQADTTGLTFSFTHGNIDRDGLSTFRPNDARTVTINIKRDGVIVAKQDVKVTFAGIDKARSQIVADAINAYISTHTISTDRYHAIDFEAGSRTGIRLDTDYFGLPLQEFADLCRQWGVAILPVGHDAVPFELGQTKTLTVRLSIIRESTASSNGDVPISFETHITFVQK